MKKKKVLKKVAIIALSSVLAAGSLTALAGCGGGGGNSTKLSVKIFCNGSDKQVNEEIMNNWAKEYSASHDLGFEIGFEFDPFSKKDEYYAALSDDMQNGTLADVIYLPPRYVRMYSRLGYVMDLSGYLSQEEVANVGRVWNNAISYYGYDGTDDYVMGQPIEYSSEKGKFVTTADKNKEVGLYGLPKDYSNFSMGYNKQFFTQELVEAYQTVKASQTRTVKNPTADKSADQFNSGVTPVKNYTAAPSGAAARIARFAADGDYKIYNADGSVKTTAHATKGEEAPLMAIGVPVTYRPFNYYLFNDYNAAKEAGDPIACLVEGLTDGQGFTVTLPGLPGWKFNITDAAGYSDKTSAAYKAAVNENAAYDSSIGHMTLTYQEYGALSWLMGYYLNTFAWDQDNGGYGGRVAKEGSNVVHYAVYGGEQYEYSQGIPLYLLPWLASSDADIVNESATTSTNPVGNNQKLSLQYLRENETVNATQLAGTATEKRTKVNLDGTTRSVDVQYGMNTERFLKVYAAFANHGAVWNANAGGAKDGKADDGNSGWNYFQQGRSIFYGAGSWDAATRNDANPAYFSFGQMPTPVSEDYALYSKTSTPDYDAATLVEYSNANNVKGTGADAHTTDSAQRAAKSEGCTTYDEHAIYANQILRQDKWAARMDSVGYAANGRLARLSENDKEGWKAEAAASLIAALTVHEEQQVTLTYAGAQLPNFVSQCNDFINYQEKAYAEGAFKDMLTPDGFADNTPYGTEANVGKKIWDYYYNIAMEMGNASHSSTQTVREWIAAKGYRDYNNVGELRYDPSYADVKLSTFTGESQNNYYSAMRALRMVNFNYAERDLNIRMQTGLNAVRDSSMYTPEVDWLNELNADTFNSSTMLTFYSLMSAGNMRLELQQATAKAIGRNFKTGYQSNDGAAKWWSPAYYATYASINCEAQLQACIREEKNMIGS